MAQYLLLIREYEPYSKNYTPDQLQQVIQKYINWSGQLRQQGRLVSSEKLVDDGGRIVRMRNRQILVDGPFTEAKEAIGGYYIIEAAGYDEAVQLARDCPVFETGGEVELHEIEPT